MLDYSKSFIETQFPVSKISKESYKERKAGASQTLTPLGKWWGRKPLILVRATLLGTLMPVSDKPDKDREIFLKILTMDDEGLWLRKSKNIPINTIYEVLSKIEKGKYFNTFVSDRKLSLRNNQTEDDKLFLQKLAFNRLSYDDKLKYCDRPERYDLVDENTWEEINSHLDTDANNLQELIRELGEKRFGHYPRIGDCFAGGGSIPFESARIGAEVYASDLNPVASLLNWTALSIIKSGNVEIEELIEFQNEIYNRVNDRLIELGVEHNDKGHRADAYLYCNEAKCPECGYTVPLSPSWVIGKKTKTVAVLYDNGNYGFDIDIIQDASKEQIKVANESATLKNYSLQCPHCKNSTPIPSIRGDYDDGISREYRYNTPNKLRKWIIGDFTAREDDIYQERLYAVRYVDENSKRYYSRVTEKELDSEKTIKEIISKNMKRWLAEGYIPSERINEGWNTNQLVYEQGWQNWYHLSNPRQILQNVFLIEEVVKEHSKLKVAIMILALNRMVDRNTKLCRWDAGSEKAQQTFYNQAFNTLFNYVSRGWLNQKDNVVINIQNLISNIDVNMSVETLDARECKKQSDIWITDPPYADAVHYHELSEFFLAWDNHLLNTTFKDWYTDSKRVLAVQGVGETFNQSMISVYKRLSENMPDDGYQVVMFTHQDVKVWSELSMILWSAGLRVVSAWNIATETEATGIKKGNYVQGTVLLTLKKQASEDFAFQDELYDEIKYEVKHIIDSMKALDDKDDPDFTDADYLLASYASSLKVLTAYKEIDGIDVGYWLSQPRDSKEENPIEKLINKAVRIAYDYLIPEGFDTSIWKDLKPEERFYIRGLEVEMSGVAKISSYQELARGFGVSDYTDMFANFKANSARLKTPSEYRMAFLNGDGFTSSLLRHLLVAIYETTENKSTVEGRAYLKNVYQQDNQYWYKKPLMVELLSFIANLEYVDHMKHWHEHAYSAKILKEALKNEGV